MCVGGTATKGRLHGGLKHLLLPAPSPLTFTSGCCCSLSLASQCSFPYSAGSSTTFGLPGTGPISWLGLFPRTALPLVPVSREVTQLTKQLTEGSAVAPPHRALLPELELAAGWGCREGGRWCVLWAGRWDEGK